MSYYFFCHVTDEQPLNTRPSMRGENDQIDALIFCRVENLFEGITTCDKISDLWQALDPWIISLLGLVPADVRTVLLHLLARFLRPMPTRRPPF